MGLMKTRERKVLSVRCIPGRLFIFTSREWEPYCRKRASDGHITAGKKCKTLRS